MASCAINLLRTHAALAFDGLGRSLRQWVQEADKQPSDNDLGKCLASRTVITFGDSTLREPAMRMIGPFVTSHMLKTGLDPHGFSQLLGKDGGVRLYFDYISKRNFGKELDQPMEVMRKLILRVPAAYWADRKVTLVFGGTTTYMEHALTLMEGCTLNNPPIPCPWLAKNGGKGASVVIKAAGASFNICNMLKVYDAKCVGEFSHAQLKEREAVLAKGYRWVDAYNTSVSSWGLVLAEDYGGCRCHFYKKDANDFRYGSVTTGIANQLADAICRD
jgi:hypothetical protein